MVFGCAKLNKTQKNEHQRVVCAPGAHHAIKEADRINGNQYENEDN